MPIGCWFQIFYPHVCLSSPAIMDISCPSHLGWWSQLTVSCLDRLKHQALKTSMTPALPKLKALNLENADPVLGWPACWHGWYVFEIVWIVLGVAFTVNFRGIHRALGAILGKPWAFLVATAAPLPHLRVNGIIRCYASPCEAAAHPM